MNPFSLLDLNFRRIFFDGASNSTTRESLVTHPREVKDNNEPSGRAGHAPTIEGLCGTAQAHGSNANEAVIVDEVDEDVVGTKMKGCVFVPGEVISTPLLLSNNPWIESIITKITGLREKNIETIHWSEREASGSSASSESHSLGLQLNEQATEHEVWYFFNNVGFMSVFEIHKTSNTKNTTAINHCIAQLGGLASLRGIAISRLTTGSDTSSHKALASFFLSQLLESLTKRMTTMSLRGERLSSLYRFRHQARASVQSLASRTNPPSHVRVTGIGECKQELNEIGDMLIGFARALNFVDRLEDIRLLMLRVNEESVAMNCVFQLQKTLYDRDGGALRDFLGLIRSTNPTVVTMAMQEAEHNVLSLEARVTP
ncbi:hypothetical protein Goshw_012295 [Gossypium schwendimanii]|uniref:Uncharacterized protein n=1 Tax=Gossypium schwendimanii TaxID=34291 RepID=A0A7J9L2V6_GOSSC|nr:hypothetical protein [Gossypium schwendimanii]